MNQGWNLVVLLLLSETLGCLGGAWLVLLYYGKVATNNPGFIFIKAATGVFSFLLLCEVWKIIR